MKKGLNYIVEFAKGIKSICLYGIFQPRIFLPVDDKKVVYLAISKAANTSIKASILGCRNVDDSISVHIDASEKIIYKIGNKEKDYFKFTFVRNPFERLVSCYESKYKTDRKYMGKQIDHMWYDFYLFGYISVDEGFDSFVRKIFRIPDHFKDYHFVPQYNVVYDKKGRCIVDYIGKVENLDKEFPILQQKFAFDDLPFMNCSDKKFWMDYYTKETARMVYRMYRRDIEIFGYHKEYKELMKYLNKK